MNHNRSSKWIELIMRLTIFKQNGFTLIELVIVVVILAVLAAAIVPNLSRYSSNSGILKQEANYEIFVNENGIDRKIGNVIMGEVTIRYPKRMRINNSDGVSATLISQQRMVTFNKANIFEVTDLNKYDIKSDVIQIYPIMNAELKAANFVISNDSHGYEQFTTNTNVHWTWIIAPKQLGDQLLLIELNTLLQVEGFEGFVTKAVYYQHFSIYIDEPFNWVEFGKNTGVIATVVASIVAVLTYFNIKRKEKRQQKM